jgi:hypothetical protein
MKKKYKLSEAKRLYLRKYMRKWRARNPERDKAIKRRWYRKQRAQGLKLLWVKESVAKHV